MRLTELHLVNFRCHRDTTIYCSSDLTVLIGENDAGKTSVLDSISILLGASRLSQADRANFCNDALATISGLFDLDEQDTLPAEYRKAASVLSMRRTVDSSGATTFEIECAAPTDPRFDNFSSLRAREQDALLRMLGLTPGKNAAERATQFSAARLGGLLPMELRWLTASEKELKAFLPSIERIRSDDYKDPASFVARTLQGIAAAVLTPTDPRTGEQAEREEFRTVRTEILEAIQPEISNIEGFLKQAHPNVATVTIEPNIDFSNAVRNPSVSITMRDTDASQTIDQFGDGTKKKIWLGFLEWERSAKRKDSIGGIIKLFDEPDTSLHYEAQRRLFASILEETRAQDTRIQSLVSTHSLVLIDRAPPESINLLRLTENGTREVRRIVDGADADFSILLREMGEAVGLTNSSILFERAFLLVEGESEETMLPTLYKRLYGREMEHDGIVLVNLKTCSSWSSVISTLLARRKDDLTLLLDNDCQEPDSSARITPAKLAELNISAAAVLFVGTKEIEDAFSNADIVSALGSHYQREDGARWDDADIQAIRNDAKFSESLKKLVRDNVARLDKSRATKPEIGSAIAKECQLNRVPAKIIDAFSRSRQLAQLEFQIG